MGQLARGRLRSLRPIKHAAMAFAAMTRDLNQMKLIDHFDKGVEADSGRACIVDSTGSKSYGEVQQASRKLANALRTLGFGPGCRVATMGENSSAVFEAIVGSLRAGCIWVPVSTNQSADAAAARISSAEANLLLYTSRYEAVARSAIAACPTLEKTICIDRSDTNSISLRALAANSDDRDPQLEQAPSDVVAILSSGGTSGVPKGVMMTNAAWETFIANFRVRYEPHPVHLVVAPLAHATGTAALALCPLGATHVFLDGFEPKKVMSSIERHRVTHLFLPSTAIRVLLGHPDVRNYDYSSLRYFVYGAAPTPVELIKEAVEVFGPVMACTFGQTEGGGDLAFLPPTDVAEAVRAGRHDRLRSCGRATPFVRLAIMDEEGRLLPNNETGEIVVQSNQVMKGYFKNDAETALVSRFGWHHTGDLGYRDDDGYFYLVDRKRDVIIVGGFNMLPREIEDVIRAYPGVRDCAVVGLPDKDWGELPVAVVEPAPFVDIDAAELQRFCASRLTPLQVPRTVDVWEALPTGQAGKVSRRLVRERLMRESAA